MKKIISIILTSILMMSICACSTDTVSTTDKEQYVLDGMSTEDIVSKLYSYTDIHTGDAYIDDYYNAPDGANAYITSVSLRGVQQEMNNTVTLGNNSNVVIFLTVSDYDLASDLYSALYNSFTQNDYEINNDRSYDNREGTEWNSAIYYTVEVDANNSYDERVMTDMGSFHYYIYQENSISMRSGVNNTYTLIVVLPIITDEGVDLNNEVSFVEQQAQQGGLGG